MLPNMRQERWVRFRGTQTSLVYETDEKGNVTTKQCVECRETRPLDAFTTIKGSFLGKHNQCNTCLAIRATNARRAKGIPPKQPMIVVQAGITTRPCSRCKVVKELTAFDKNPSGYMGHDSDCAECKRKRGELYRRGKGIRPAREVPILTDSGGNPTDRECSRCQKMLPLSQFNKHISAYLGVHPYCKSCAADRHLIGKYGLTASDKAQMYQEQNEECAICFLSIPLAEIHVDHCHKTGRVRGLLCSACNKALGLLKDDPERCKNMAVYLTLGKPQA